MSDLVNFLLARIAEDEAVARAATPGPWEWEPETDGWGDCGPNLVTVAKLPPYSDGSIGPVAEVVGSWGHDANGIAVDDADAAHIARWDTTRVLAECEAKRRLILACTHEQENWVTVRPGVRQNMPVRVPWGDDDLYEDALRYLALPYADHPDFRPEWRLSTNDASPVA
ncbi:MAG: hypothetical protein HOQ45_06965 [Nocardioidaceae bacterium]|nr:hypothetical protein [Nocardioidaceae bacterium]